MSDTACPLKTDRDLYYAITTLTASREREEPELELYLRSLLRVFESVRSLPSLSLGGAYDAPPMPFLESWRLIPHDPFGGERLFDDCLVVLARQIADLRELKEEGELEKEDRYFGITRRSGGTWYNFDVSTYLECAGRGSFVDNTRKHRSVVQLPFEGGSEAAESHAAEALHALTWSDVIQFLDCGQGYE